MNVESAPRHHRAELGIYQPSVRECFVPRPGKVYSTSDYEAGEMVTWAESSYQLVGHSSLGEALKRGIKPHSALGARVLAIDYEAFEARRKAKESFIVSLRQLMKEPNFGYPAGMGAATLVLRARKSRDADTPCPDGPLWISDGAGGSVRGYRGVRFCITMRGAKRCGDRKAHKYRGKPVKPVCSACLECAVELREKWGLQWEEAEDYFAYVSTQVGQGYVLQIGDDRRRAGVDFCNAANGYFQALLARIAKRALWRVSRECYDATRKSVLYGARVCGFFHDELIAEHPVERLRPYKLASEQAERLAGVMVEVMQEECPHVASAAAVEPALMTRWDKRAQAVRGPDGHLVPWRAPGRDPFAELDDNAGAAAAV